MFNFFISDKTLLRKNVNHQKAGHFSAAIDKNSMLKKKKKFRSFNFLVMINNKFQC